MFGDGPTSDPVYINMTDTQFSHLYNCSKYKSLHILSLHSVVNACFLDIGNIDSSNQVAGSFGVLVATVVGSVSLLILIVSSIFFITAITILAMSHDKAKSVRDVSREQETSTDSTNRVEYEEIEINQRIQSESTVISMAENVAYEHITKKCD